MNRTTIKIIAGVLLVGVAILAAVALSASARADYWANYVRTSPARAARHLKREEPEAPEMREDELQNSNQTTNEKSL